MSFTQPRDEAQSSGGIIYPLYMRLYDKRRRARDPQVLSALICSPVSLPESTRRKYEYRSLKIEGG